jgi:hypothetical protein
MCGAGRVAAVDAETATASGWSRRHQGVIIARSSTSPPAVVSSATLASNRR